MAMLKELIVFCAAAFIVVACTCVGALDLTLVPGEGGADVVRGVLTKLDSSEIFTTASADSSSLADAFMRRMAFVETRDGEAQSYPDGGIWNIAEDTFMQTKMYTDPSTSNVIANIDSCFEVDWMSLPYEELQKPFYSGIASRLFLHNLESNEGELVPVKSQQARYWMTHFPRAGASEEMWTESVEELDNRGTETCSVNTDVVFVLDDSGSITLPNFELVKNFTHAFIESIKDSKDDRIGIIIYADLARVELNLDSPLNLNKTSILERVLSIPYTGRYTNTPDGLCKLTTQPWRSGLGVLRLAVVLTDGQTNRQSTECGGLEPAAQRVHNMKPPIQVFAVGIGDGINYNELEIIASEPQYISNVTSFSIGLLESQEKRSYEICNTVEQPVTVGELNNGTTGQGDTTRLSFDGEGITVRLCLMNGGMELFASSTIKNPNAAIHDFRAMVNSTGRTAVNCLTKYFDSKLSGTRTKRRGVTTLTRLYVSLSGLQVSNVFTVNSGDGNVTFDVNECEQDPCDSVATCHNTDGSFFCQCSSGYILNGTKCEDVNECEQEPRVCGTTEDCFNSIGSYQCKVKTVVIIIVVVVIIGTLVIAIFSALLILMCVHQHRRHHKSAKAEDTSQFTMEEQETQDPKSGYKNPAFEKKHSPKNAKRVERKELQDASDNDSEDEWNYTLTLTWQTEK